MNTVLIIEDDQVLSDMYRDKFAFDNFTVTTASDGAEGLTFALHDKPNIILLDLAIPKMDGLTLMKTLRTDSWGQKVPIIVLTNLNVDGKILEGIMQYKPVYCLLKANTTPEDVLFKAKDIINNSV